MQLEFGLEKVADAIANGDFSQLFVLTDKRVKEFCYPLFKKHLPKHKVIITEEGESHKTLESCQKIWSQLIVEKADRRSLIINLGGGIITDLGGFVAASFKRGIAFINVPTSLLSMVDASIGNKTGVNFKGIKNQIGFFAKPLLVCTDSVFLETLPKGEYLSGLGEVYKYAFIHENDLLKNLSKSEKLSESQIAECAAIKLSIVDQDPLEKGIRQSLNFGHTLGHAFESLSQEKSTGLKHGVAIALGMLAEMHISKEKFEFQDFEQCTDILLKAFEFPENSKEILETPELLLPYILADKKNVAGEVKACLLQEIGKPRWAETISQDQIERSLKWLSQRIK